MKKIITAVTLVLISGTISLQAATKIYWNGSIDNLYTNGANWVGGVVPTDNDYTDQIWFNDSKLSGVSNKTTTLTGSRKINAIVFENTGYSINGSELTTKYLNSYGIGTNTIADLKSGTSSYTYNIRTNSTVVINAMYQDNSNQTLTFQGGGTLIFNDYIDAWGTGYQKINDVLMIVRANKVHAKTTSITKLMLQESELQLLTTVSGAEALITAGRITENLGQGLQVTDIGGGYVSIMIKEPVVLGTIILLQ